MDTAQLIVTIIGAGGGGAALLAIVNGLFGMATGRAGREREKATDIEAQRQKAVLDRDHADAKRIEEVGKAEERRDEADRKRREAEEHCGILIRQLRENNIIPAQRPEGSQGDSNG